MAQGPDLSKLSDLDLDALSRGKMSDLSDQGLDYLHSAVNAQEPETESIAHGAWRGLTEGTGVGQGVKDALKSQNEYNRWNWEHNHKAIEGEAPIAIPAEAAPAELMKLVGILKASAPARIAANGAIGAGMGAAKDPGEGGSRLKNAGVGFGMGAGASALGEMIAKAIPYVGGKLMGVAPDNAQAYADNPELAEETAAQFKNAPDELNASLRGRIKGDLGTIFKEKSAPLLQQRGELLAGKNISLDPSQYAGTAAEPELQRVAALTPGSNEATGKMTLTGAQAQRAKELLQDAADYSKTAATAEPLKYAAKSQADALAASNMRKALEGAAPGVADINQELGERARMSDAAKQIFNTNPSRILNSSETLGNTNIRAIQRYLDENAGSNFEETAKALSAGRAINESGKSPGFHGILERFLFSPLGKAVLKASEGASSALRAPAPILLQYGKGQQDSKEDNAIGRRLGSK